jgi:assimilatory nitrate reductase catalytic subunit
VSEMNADTDTVREAHVRLPAAGWGEKDGTVTNSERRITRQRPFLSLPGEARPDWWIVSEVARRMGFGAAFAYQNAGEIFAEHAALSAFENDGRRDFNLSGLIGVNYDTLAPVQWPVREHGTARMFGDGRFFGPNQKSRFVAVIPPPPLTPAPGQLTLNTGRVRDHWHTMTRTGKSARLTAHIAEPFAEIHPKDATRLGIKRATLVRLENRHGSATVRALITDRQRPGSVFVPMHWTDRFSSSGRVEADPYSGQPALKMAEIIAAPARVVLYGFAVSRSEIVPGDASYWASARTPDGFRTELAWDQIGDWEARARALFGVAADTTMLTLRDERSGRMSFALFDGTKLLFALYLSPDPVLVSRQWAANLLGLPVADVTTRSRVLAGRPGADVPDPGPIVCACHSVGMKTIVKSIEDGCSSVEAVGATTKAGTNCGSCRAEIRAVLAALQATTGA